MNFKTKTQAVSRLIRWYLANEETKHKLEDQVKKYDVFDETKSGKERKFTKLTCYTPGKDPIGSYFITPGLHPLGADHEKIDDMCMMLASMGYVVYAPYVRDYRVLYITHATYDDFASAFDRACADLKENNHAFKLNLFSISFGSLLSLRLAGDTKRQKQVNSVIIFGGYGDWQSTCDEIMEKALFGKREKGYGDIRSIPAIFNHIIEYVDDLDKGSLKKLRALWVDYMTTTWMDESYLERDKCLKFARELVQKSFLSEKEEIYFLKGCGLEEGTFQLYHTLAKRGTFDQLNPLVNAPYISCAVYLLHGKFDRLIPCVQQKIIKEALPAKVVKRQVLTKLYAHTTPNKEGSALLRVLGTIPELRNLFRIFLTLSLPNATKINTAKITPRKDGASNLLRNSGF